MFSPGWLSSLFRAVQRRVRSDDESSRQSALDGAFDEGLDPEGDVSEDEESPRRVLLAAVRRGDGRRLDDNPLSRDLLEMIDRMPLDAVAPEVQVARAGDARPIQAMPAAVSWFDAPEDLDEIAAPLRPFAVRIRAGDVEFAGAIVGGTVVTAVNGDEATPLLVSAGDAAQRAMSGRAGQGPSPCSPMTPCRRRGRTPPTRTGRRMRTVMRPRRRSQSRFRRASCSPRRSLSSETRCSVSAQKARAGAWSPRHLQGSRHESRSATHRVPRGRRSLISMGA